MFSIWGSPYLLAAKSFLQSNDVVTPDDEEEGCPARQVRAAQEVVSCWERKGSYMSNSSFILGEVSARRKQVPHGSILGTQSSTYR